MSQSSGGEVNGSKERAIITPIVPVSGKEIE
jgi:hypothetical protein